MGGMQPITVREQDGTEHKMSVWTNWLPCMIDNLKFLDQNEEHFKHLFSTFEKMQAEDHYYAESPYLAPAGYGLVVVDFQNNKLLDCNGYHHFGRMFATGLRIEFRPDASLSQVVESGLGHFDPYSGIGRWYDFYKNKKLKGVINTYENKMVVNEEINEWPLVKVLGEFIFNDEKYNDDKVRNDFDFVLDMSPLEATRFPESREGYHDFYKAVKELGFELSDLEEKMWREWFEVL